MPQRNKFYFILVFFLAFLTIAGINVRAHPPAAMSLEYNSGTNTLKVSITHGVSDNTTHYVNSVVVRVNGSIVLSPTYTSQPSTIYFIYEYTVVTANGSTIQVTASCNQGGSITETLGGTNQPPGGGIPGYMGIYLVLAVSVITILALFRKKLKNQK